VLQGRYNVKKEKDLPNIREQRKLLEIVTSTRERNEKLIGIKNETE